MQEKSAGSENLIGVGGSIKDGAAKIWGQLVVGLLSNFKNRILGGWLSFTGFRFLDKDNVCCLVCEVEEGMHNICRFCCIVLGKAYGLVGTV